MDYNGVVMKINSIDFIKKWQGPSARYYEIMERFDSILADKLGVKKNIDMLSYKGNSDYSSSIDGKSLANIASNPADYGNIFSAEGLSHTDFLKNNLNQDSINSANLIGNQDNISNLYRSIVQSTVPSAKGGLADTLDIRKKSKASPSTLNQKLIGSRLEGMGEHFKRAEDLYGVNAYVLMAIAKLESNWGESKIATDKKNLFGLGAYDSSPYESARSYNSYEESIYDVAKYLSNNYLNPRGKYFNGYSLEGVNVKYCTSPDWASKVGKIVRELTS